VKRHPEQKIKIIVGFSKMKDATSMLEYLASSSQVSSIYTVTTNH
jgi:hypothetical protein